MSSGIRASADELWAITSYFNPMRYRRRLSNFKTFRNRLKVPLLAVELSYDAEFELHKQHDAEILIQLHAGAILWQKERLLNVALKSLPKHCDKVAWLDCDVIFGNTDWPDSTKRLLDSFPIIQLYKHVHYLSPAWNSEIAYLSQVEFTRASAAYSILSGISAVDSIAHSLDIREGTSANGFAWAARREILDQHGFFDACIIGGGDRAMTCAAHHCFDQLMNRQYMNNRQRDRYLAWAAPFYRTVQGETGYLEQDLFHLWHGDVRERRTRGRHKGLQPFAFDPFTDVALEPNGCWRWNTDKPDMHGYIRDYFVARREDG